MRNPHEQLARLTVTPKGENWSFFPRSCRFEKHESDEFVLLLNF
jgi:hypothetical protein